ncbi:PQQ-binding-like beta-propeller repeat protein [Xanthomonas sp. D-109]|uniref:outer membrane protein assembly factor BamB family protein n=1 Tax=Xanthomonas sp. D-109 TaxID=2821274 RepID=UPI001FD01DDA|nr:PQQ-binding-like beta-propeller repeat protein [Xanthomonas sp. D-109]
MAVPRSGDRPWTAISGRWTLRRLLDPPSPTSSHSQQGGTMTMQSLRDLIQTVGLHTSAENIPLITKKGGSYLWLFDLRRVFMRRAALEQIAEAFWERNAARPPFQLGGLETAAIPLLTALLLTAPKERGPVNGFIIRKDRKTTGMGNAIEGDVLDLPIVLVDDSLNSGNSAEKARAVIAAAGHALDEVFVVVDFLSKAGMQWRKTHAISVQTLFTLKDFDLPPEQSAPPPTQAYRELWRTATPGGFAFHVVPKSAPLLVGDMIYRGCDAAKMQAFSAETGGLVWEYPVTGAAYTKKGIWSCPAYHDGRLYFGAYNGTVYCLNAASGEEIWTHPDGDWVGASPLLVPRHKLLYVGIEYVRPWAQGSLAAYAMDTGEKIWEHQVQKLQHGSPGYWEGGDLVIWGSADHETLALDARTGRIAWRFKTRRSVKYAPAVDERRGLTAFASFDKSIYVLDVATGEKRGEWQTDEICYTTPLFAGNKLFCGSGDRHLYVIDIDTMQLIKKINLRSRVYASPKRIGNRVIVGSNGGRVVEIDIDTLETVGVLQLPDAVTNGVAISPDERRIYVSTYMNHLYAFERLSDVHAQSARPALVAS